MKSKSLFLGSKGENGIIFKELIETTINESLNNRYENNKDEQSIFKNDEIESDSFKLTKNEIYENTISMINYLKGSLPFSSLRYQGHMIPDPTIPSLIGTIAGLMVNQNNLIPQFSNKTTLIEAAFSKDICKMIGYDTSKIPNDDNLMYEMNIVYPFSHITGGGCISNFEAVWTSYWIKFIPISLKNAILNDLDYNIFNHESKNIKVLLNNNLEKRLIDCDNWELVNLNNDISVKLPYEILNLNNNNNLTMELILTNIKNYHPTSIGNFEFLTNNNLTQPVYFIPASAHYSFKKAISILGLGSNSTKSVKIDLNGRMDLTDLKNQLNYCLINKIPVIGVAAMLGTTQESAVDNIEEILNIRKSFNLENNFNYSIHVDGAYGGYYLSLINEHFPITGPFDDTNLFVKNNITNDKDEDKDDDDLVESFEPELILSEFLKKQLYACRFSDSMTIDGHKSGYIPYVCGTISYRNSKWRDLTVFAGPYVTGGLKQAIVGLFGVEGSRAGHTAISAYLSHSILRPCKTGYAKLLKRCLLNSKLFYLKLYSLNNNNFRCYPIGIKSNSSHSLISKINQSNSSLLKNLNEIVNDIKLLKELSNIGTDLSINCFCFNFKLKNGNFNNDYNEFIKFNNEIISKLGTPLLNENSKLFFATTTFTNENYGNHYTNEILNSIGITENLPNENQLIKIPVLRSTTMNPWLSEINNNSSYLDTMIDIIKNEINLILNKN